MDKKTSVSEPRVPGNNVMSSIQANKDLSNPSSIGDLEERLGDQMDILCLSDHKPEMTKVISEKQFLKTHFLRLPDSEQHQQLGS